MARTTHTASYACTNGYYWCLLLNTLHNTTTAVTIVINNSNTNNNNNDVWGLYLLSFGRPMKSYRFLCVSKVHSVRPVLNKIFGKKFPFTKKKKREQWLSTNQNHTQVTTTTSSMAENFSAPKEPRDGYRFGCRPADRAVWERGALSANHTFCPTFFDQSEILNRVPKIKNPLSFSLYIINIIVTFRVVTVSLLKCMLRW